ncbi:MAG: hypothetical protein D6681_22085, partial [Calditrichaeota bacterium]
MLLSLCLVWLVYESGASQEVKTAKSGKWELSGRVQVQHLYNTSVSGDSTFTNQGFRIRRGRLKIKAKISKWITGKLQMEVRDNSPRLKDAEAKLKLSKRVYFRFGQFKVPVWREELRSSGKLLLVERGPAAAFLAHNLLAARHIGAEFGAELGEQVSIIVNWSNGAGEGGREDAGRSKSGQINNGKMLATRINVAVSRQVEVGLSAAANRLGNTIAASGLDNRGTHWVIAPDFGIYLPSGVIVEGGLALGTLDKKPQGSAEDRRFLLFDIAGSFRQKLAAPRESLAGMDAVEFALGFSFVEPNRDLSDDESLVVRFGPAVYFGRQARLQVNGEIISPT